MSCKKLQKRNKIEKIFIKINIVKAKKKLINTTFFLEVCLMELDQGKIINCVLDRILH